MMLNELADHLVAKTAASTLKLVSAVNLFEGDVPSTTITGDKAVLVLIESAASPSLETFSAGRRLVRPRIQLYSRAIDYEKARAIIRVAHGILRDTRGITLGGTKYLNIGALDEPTFLERDQNKYPSFTSNYELLKRDS